MGWKVNTFAGLSLAAMTAAVVWPSIHASWFVSGAERKKAAQAMHAATDDIRRIVGAEFLTLKSVPPRETSTADPDYGLFTLRVDQKGIIRARSARYDLIMHFVPARAGKQITWRCIPFHSDYEFGDCKRR